MLYNNHSVIAFPAAHVRASAASRAANEVSMAAVKAFPFARSVERTADHHSAGIPSRCHHLETAEAPAPISDAMASREGHSSITDRKDDRSLMSSVLGQLVLNCKANLSLDGKMSLGHYVRMSDSDVETQYKQEFTARIKSARMATGLKQWQVADALGLPQDHYKHWEKSRLMPHHLIGRFCVVCRVDPEWLMTGKGEKPLKPPRVVSQEEAPIPKPRKAGRSKAA